MTQAPSDTSPESAGHLRQLLAARSGEQRVRMACEMFDSARRLVVASLPEAIAADPLERSIALVRRLYGRDLEPAMLEQVIAQIRRRGEPATSRSSDAKLRTLDEHEREQMRRWLENWQRVGPLLEAERRERVAALTGDDAWDESQELFQAWQPEMTGDAGEGLLLQQDVFARCRRIAR